MCAQRVPVLRVGNNLLVSIQFDLTDHIISALQTDILTELEKRPAAGVLIDISALDLVDSYMGRTLTEIAKQAALMDARGVITGMRPAVAITLIELGVSLERIATALDVDSGMELLAREEDGPVAYFDAAAKGAGL